MILIMESVDFVRVRYFQQILWSNIIYPIPRILEKKENEKVNCILN